MDILICVYKWLCVWWIFGELVRCICFFEMLKYICEMIFGGKYIKNSNIWCINIV